MKDKSISRRIFIFGIAATLVWGIVVARLFLLQVIRGAEFEEQAKMQYQRVIESEAPRGEVLDRQFKRLAVDLAYCAFGAHTQQVEDTDRIAEVFASRTGQSKNAIRRKLRSVSPFVWLDRKVDLEIGEKIQDEKLKGITRLIKYRRYYPYGATAGHVLGFTNVDNVGIAGMELQFDKILAGEPGKMIFKTDARGGFVPDPSHIVQRPVKGNTLVLTIDLIYQSILDEELRMAVEKSGARSGLALLMNPKTGEILGMSAFPTFNPNDANRYGADLRKNRTITDTFEPGSTFKIVTAAAALEERAKKPADKIFCENGKFRVYNHIVGDVHPYGTLTFREVIEKSSNIGTMKIARDLGRNVLYKYARDFGFGTETGIRLIGEVRGTLRQPKDWSGLSLFSIAIGQEVAVTALQLINAYAAIANGGILVKPQIIYAEFDSEDHIISRFEPQPIRRVVSQETADTLKSFFAGVVESGTATRAHIDGLSVAGKTGTAQRAAEGKRGYAESNYISSFVGFAPAEDPQIVGLIVVENPKGAYYGGIVAAPALKNVFQRVFALPNRPSELQLVDLTEEPVGRELGAANRIPDVRGCWRSVAEERLLALDFKPLFVGVGGFVSGQIPTPGIELGAGQNVILTLSSEEPDFENEITVPDVRGASIRKAVNILSENRIRVEIDGHGQVISQSLPPGTLAPVGALCVLKCRPDAG